MYRTASLFALKWKIKRKKQKQLKYSRINTFKDRRIFLQLNTIEDTIENAKKQIEDRKYETNLLERDFKNITKMIFAFKGKEVKIEVY